MNMLILGLSVRRPEVENVSYGVTVYHINTHIQLELAAIHIYKRPPIHNITLTCSGNRHKRKCQSQRGSHL